MKLALFLCLALGIVPAYGEEHWQAPSVAAAVFLYTQFEQEPPPAVMDALHHELQTIMTPIGLRFEWRELASPRINEASVELAVVNFKGRCDAADLLGIQNTPGALGWTHVSDGIILPFSVVDCDRIRDFIQRQLLAVAPKNREAALGRAIARVLAHELYHIFANTSRHGSCGIARASYTVQELLAPEFQFERRETEVLRGSKAYTALENAGSLQ